MATELEKLAAYAVAQAGGPHPCHLIGHKWVSTGGKNAGCCDGCGCSVPVNECQICGDCDYGENEDAEDIRKSCLNDQ